MYKWPQEILWTGKGFIVRNKEDGIVLLQIF